MKVIKGLKELEILVHSFFVCLVQTSGATRAPRRNVHLVIVFSKTTNNEPKNRVPEMSLCFMQNIQIYYPSGKYKFSIRSFLEYYCYCYYLQQHNLYPLYRFAFFFFLFCFGFYFIIIIFFFFENIFMLISYFEKRKKEIKIRYGQRLPK